MRHASLFSGIGGFDLAAQWMGWENVFNCEIDPFCQKVLKHHFPTTTQYGDIRTIKGTDYTGRIDILTGGFPCQPFSAAGKRRGTEDNRFLWPEMLRVIREIKPTWVVAENVRGITAIENGMVFERVCAELEANEYEVQPFCIPACAVGAPHRRDRIWFIANTNTIGLEGGTSKEINKINKQKIGVQQKIGYCSGRSEWRKNWNEVAARLCRVDDGLPRELYLFRGMGYPSTYERNSKSKDTQKKPTLKESVWREMQSVWSDWKAAPPSLRNEGEGICNTLCPLPCERTQEDWFRDVGQTEEGKTVLRLWNRICAEPFQEAQNLFPELLERIGEIERKKKVGRSDLTVPKWRKESLKAYGNAIVPQVAYEIFKSIEYA